MDLYLNKEPFIRKYAFGIFLLFFALLFLQFPLNGSLPGLQDSFWYVGVFNDYANRLMAIFTGLDHGTVFYPDGDAGSSGEPAYGGAVLYLTSLVLGLSNIWASYVQITFVFATSAYGCYKLASLYLPNTWGALFAGFIFASSAFAFGHSDDQKVFTFFTMFMSVYHFKIFLETGHRRNFLYTALLGGLTIYFSSYSFVFQSITLGVLGLMNLGKIIRNRKMLKDLILIFPLYVIVIAPFAYKYVVMGLIENSYNPIDVINHAKAVTLNLEDFLQSSRNNLLYSNDFHERPSWIWQWHSAFIGISAIFLFLLGTLVKVRKSGELFVLLITGLVLGIGPSFMLGDTEVLTPFYWLYKNVKQASYIRIPVRAWFIGLIAVSVFAGGGLAFIMEKARYPLLFLGLFLGIFLVENVPMPFPHYPSAQFMDPPSGYYEFLERYEQKVMVNLPTRVKDNRYVEGWDGPTREHAYMFWQTVHHHNVLNGSGYLTLGRVKNQDLIDSLQRPGSLDTLIANNGLELILYLKKIRLPDESLEDYEFLKSSPRVKMVYDSDEVAGFEVVSSDK